MTRRVAVLGSPVGHSLSPVLHRAAYAALGLDWTYDAIDVKAIGLAEFLENCGPEWVGLSLTMPLKTAVLHLLSELEPVAAQTRAVNTVLLPSRIGYNTDVAGMVAALAEAGVVSASSASIIGNGAAARSATVALAALGVARPAVVARTPTSDQIPWVDGPAHLGADIVICTVPAAAAPVDWIAQSPPGVLLDVAYPAPAPFASAWQHAGGVAIGGERMLLHQAARQVELFTGRPPPLEAMAIALSRR